MPPTWSSAGRVIAPFGVAPGGACLAAHVSAGAGGLLHHRFTLAAPSRGTPVGGLLSVALSIGFPRPGVTRHPCPAVSRLSSAPEGVATVRSAAGVYRGASRRRLVAVSSCHRSARSWAPAGLTFENVS